MNIAKEQLNAMYASRASFVEMMHVAQEAVTVVKNVVSGGFGDNLRVSLITKLTGDPRYGRWGFASQQAILLAEKLYREVPVEANDPQWCKSQAIALSEMREETQEIFISILNEIASQATDRSLYYETVGVLGKLGAPWRPNPPAIVPIAIAPITTAEM